MATQVKCIYEDGYLKPLQKIGLGEHEEVLIIVEKSRSKLENELKQGYEEMADESLRITREWEHLDLK